VTRIEPSGFERVASWITTLAPLFLLGGILGGYIEFKTPGFGIPGNSLDDLLRHLLHGHYIAGLSGWETAFFFGLGVALVLTELLIFPGMIFPGAAGVLLILGALIYAMVDRYPSQPVMPDSAMLLRPLTNLSIAFLLTLAAAVVLARYLPRTSFYHSIVLGAAIPAGPAVSEPLRCSASRSASRGPRARSAAEWKGRIRWPAL
jgi:membrane-bound serine protease (ClpP class)